jgi:hypothetical protein
LFELTASLALGWACASSELLFSSFQIP